MRDGLGGFGMLRSGLIAAALALFLTAFFRPEAAFAQSDDDAAAIRSTIQSQLSAMQQDRWAEAFTYASPTIQGIFRSHNPPEPVEL